LRILDLREPYLKEVLFNPKYGYGKNFNPCIDCHGFMFRFTGDLLKEYNADFMISGEVLGQRPMSQRKDAMGSVQKLSNHEELIVRPLSAKLMPPSKPELEGWIDREKLLNINGRSRHIQLELAKEIGLKDFDTPGGGCLLTEIQFSEKLRDFIKYDRLDVEDIDTLKAGRHLRLPKGAKLIVGRDKDDNEKLKNTNSSKYYSAKILDATGPICLFQKNASQEDIDLATSIIITYGRTNLEQEYKVSFIDEEDEKNNFFTVGKKFETKNIIKEYLI